MQAIVRMSLLAAAGLAAPLAAHAQSTSWSEAPDTTLTVPAELILRHEQLRDFAPSGEPVVVKRYGRLRIEVRQVVTGTSGNEAVVTPASVQVTYRNRLIAAAQGYRLGGDFTHNGVLLESWDGGDSCEYTLWRLEFSGERLDLTETKRLPVGDCARL